MYDNFIKKSVLFCQHKEGISKFGIREGPSLNRARWDHACGKFDLRGRYTFLVVAGGANASNSVELLELAYLQRWLPGL